MDKEANIGRTALNLFKALFLSRPQIGQGGTVLARRHLLTKSIPANKVSGLSGAPAGVNVKLRNLTLQQLNEKNVRKALSGMTGKPSWIGHPLAVSGAAVGGTGAAGVIGHRALSTSAPSDLESAKIIQELMSVPKAAPEPEPTESMLPYVGGGAAAGGLTSILYGNLRNKPDLQRDLLGAMLGAGVGSAAYLVNQDRQQKEAVAWVMPVAKGAGAIAAYVGLDRLLGAGERKRTELHQTDTMQRVADLEAREKAQREATTAKDYNQLRGQDMAVKGVAGATIGGGAGMALSRLYSRFQRKKPDLRQDLLGVLLGAGSGAMIGLSEARKVKPPESDVTT